MTIDVIIPLYRPGKELFALLDALAGQTLPIRRVLLLNTEKDFLDRLISEEDLTAKYPNTEIRHLTKSEFDHGGTRRLGVELSGAEVFVMMTQDAVPADGRLLEKLTAHLKGDVAAAYARQLPREDCSPEERCARAFNYPGKSRIRSAADLEELGIRTFFCSNVCAAYRRDIYDRLGGFVQRTIFNEDMIYAAGAIQNGYRIAYEAQARVYHSHNYTNLQQFRRNFDLGVSQAEHPEVFADVPPESEGRSLVGRTTRYLWDSRRAGRIPRFYLQCACRYAGYFLGKHYRKLPRSWVLACTSNRDYWR